MTSLGQFPGREFPEQHPLLGSLHHQPLGLELQDRVAHRAATDAQSLGQRAMRHPVPGRQAAIDDHPPDRTVGLGGLVFIDGGGIAGIGRHQGFHSEKMQAEPPDCLP
jgi:hypothetical protein